MEADRRGAFLPWAAKPPGPGSPRSSGLSWVTTLGAGPISRMADRLLALRSSCGPGPEDVALVATTVYWPTLAGWTLKIWSVGLVAPGMRTPLKNHCRLVALSTETVSEALAPGSTLWLTGWVTKRGSCAAVASSFQQNRMLPRAAAKPSTAMW